MKTFRPLRVPHLILRTGLACILVGTTLGLAPSATADFSDESTPAATSNAGDISESETAYAQHLTSSEGPKCPMREESASGKGQEFFSDPFNARDVARWSVVCQARLGAPEFDLRLTIHFDYWSPGSPGHWVHMDTLYSTNTQRTCLKPSALAVAFILDCVNTMTYPIDHESLQHFHRAHYTIRDPFEPDLEFFSPQWWSPVMVGPD